MNITDATSVSLKKQITRAYSKHISALVSGSAEHSPYMVTTVFGDFSGLRELSFPEKIKYVHREYDRAYRHLTSNLMNNFSKKHHLHPITFDFIDIPETQHPTNINFFDLPTPHIHSVYLVHDKTQPRFESLASENFASIVRHRSMSALTSMHATKIPPCEISDVVAYSAKFLELSGAVARAEDAPLFSQFPIGDFERRTRRAGLRHNRLIGEATQNDKDRLLFEAIVRRHKQQLSSNPVL